jgi:hypothetical protein
MGEIFLSVQIFWSKNDGPQGDFYTFKEIEKMATQQKKIVVQSVKEILQSLVNDNLVLIPSHLSDLPLILGLLRQNRNNTVLLVLPLGCQAISASKN